MATRRPRTLPISSSESLVRSRPSNRISPASMRPGLSTSPMIEKPTMDLPPPDSPTRPRISPGIRSKETPSTAFTTPPKVWNQVFSPLTLRSASVAAALISASD